MKRKYLSGSSKRKDREKRLRNEEKGKPTLDQLNWGNVVSHAEHTTSSLAIASNPITEQDNVANEHKKVL